MQRAFSLLLLAAIVAVFCAAPAVAAEEPKCDDLLKSKDLGDWDYFLAEEGVEKEAVWSFNDDGVLVCKGKPLGYLCTKKDYKNFEIVVEWKWPGKPGNSGVLMRITGDPKPLPCCIEAQLQSGSAGDLYGFHGKKIAGEGLTERESDFTGKMCGLKKLEGAEKEPGEWNKYVIRAKDGKIDVTVNGKKVNSTTDADTEPGKIGFQSEGGEIHFRTIKVWPID